MSGGKNTRTRQEPYVFSEHLQSRLARIPDYPVTLVQAPSGFGKTTAVREYLRCLPGDRREKWYTCLGESPKDAWIGISRLFDEAGGKNDDLARRMSALFPPSRESLPDIAALMRECRCKTETFLVIDNYQLFDNAEPYGIINAFSVHAVKNLHIIIITQPLMASGNSVHNAGMHKLGVRDFFFDRGSTARLCHVSGAKLSEAEIDEIQTFSGGWVAAIRLQVANHHESGSFVYTSDMNSLIETAIWNRLSGEQRDFLMSVSLLNGFTVQQAAMMCAWTELPESCVVLLENNVFIPHLADKGLYSIHSLLRSYLLQRFDDQPSSFTAAMRRRAGFVCGAASEYLQAAQFFVQIGEYDAILSMPFTPRYLYSQDEQSVLDVLERIMAECPEDVLRKYPFTLLAMAFQFLKIGKRELFSRTLRLLQGICAESGLSAAELSRVKGEVALLLSLTAFNDITKMSEYHREAAVYLNGEPSSVVLGVTPWTFGITSVLCLFWSGVGELDAELALMDEKLPVYSRLTSGHGAGAASVFHAEAHMMRGDDTAAEVACHKAIYLAREARQVSIRLCAELVLARVALVRGDGAGYAALRDSMTNNAHESRQKFDVRMGELCLARLDLMTGDTHRIPEWLRCADSIRRLQYVQGHAYAFMLHCMMLLQERRHAELYGLTDPLLNLARRMRYLLPQVYQYIFLAVAQKKDGALVQASEYLGAALAIALPDRVYLPFAEFGVVLAPLLKTAGQSFDAEKMHAVMELCRRVSSGVASIVQQSGKGTRLTPREREIALYAKERFSTREIANRFFISENTVKTFLKAIYHKLGVNSRRDLSKMAF